MQGGFHMDCMLTAAGIIGSEDCNAPLSISAKKAQYHTLYPNPAGNTVTLSLPNLKQGQTANIAIYNTTGNLVKEVNNIKQENTVDISNLATGLYYYRILTTDGKSAAGRFVKE